MVFLGGMWFMNHHRHHHNDDNDNDHHNRQQEEHHQHQQNDDEDTVLCYTDIEHQQEQQRQLLPDETNEYDHLKSLLLNNHNHDIYHEEQSCTTTTTNNNNERIMNNYDTYQYNTLSMNNHSPRRSSNSLFADDEHDNDHDNNTNNNKGIKKSFSSIGFGIDHDYNNNHNNSNEKDILFNTISHVETSKYYGSFRHRRSSSTSKNQYNDMNHYYKKNDIKASYEATTSQQVIDMNDNDNDNNIPNITRNLDNEIDYVVLRWCAVYSILYIIIGIISYSYIFEQWTIIDSIYFAVTTFTTVGYGDLQPSTSIGQLFTILYALYGVLILGIFIGIIGHTIGTNQYNTIEQMKQKQLKTFLYDLFYLTSTSTSTTNSISSYQCCHPQKQQAKTNSQHQQQQHEQISMTTNTQSLEENKTNVTVTMSNGKKRWNNIVHRDNENMNEKTTSIIEIIKSFINDHTILLRIIIQNIRNHLLEIIMIGTLAFILGIRENWTITSTLYFAVMSASTTGYGDYTPKTQIDKLYCIFFLPLSVAVFGEVLGSIATTYIQKRQSYIVTQLMNKTLNKCDLRNMDSDHNGNVDIYEFTCFMLVALQKCDQETINELHFIFHSFDKNGNGLLEKNDLVQVTRRSDCLSTSSQQQQLQQGQIITTSDEFLSLDDVV